MGSLDVTVTTAGVSYCNKSIWDGVVFSYEQNWRNDSSIYCTGTYVTKTHRQKTDRHTNTYNTTNMHAHTHAHTYTAQYIAIWLDRESLTLYNYTYACLEIWQTTQDL